MRSSRPPLLATWLIARLVPGEHTESLIGDLMEQFNCGRSPGWYWRQAISAVATTFAAEMWRHKWTAICVVVFSANLSRLYMSRGCGQAPRIAAD
jgi:hypothetical protein